jgi:hypothetical protein
MKLATGKIHSNPGLKKYNETSVLSWKSEISEKEERKHLALSRHSLNL